MSMAALPTKELPIISLDDFSLGGLTSGGQVQ